MATRTDSHVFPRPRSKYPWIDWTDGGTWRIVKGEDYTISTVNMQISLHCRAKVQGLKVRSNSFTDHNEAVTIEGLVFQFYKPHKERK